MRIALLAGPLLLASCGLFRSQPKPIPEEKVLYFNGVSYPAFHEALYLDYTAPESALSIYPLSDKGYEFDFVVPGYKGYVNIDTAAQRTSRKYRNYFKDSMALTSESSMWLSAVNFQELQQNGTTTMNFGGDSSVTFEFKGIAEHKVLLDDTAFVFSVVEIVGKEKPYYISFLPDPEYPLIIKQVLHVSVELVNMQNRASHYNDFAPGPGCVLKYKMTERYTEEYEINLHNTFWSDTAVKFRLRGSYKGTEYSYDFDYDVVYRNKAILRPDFMLPVFSAIKGEMLEDTFNWFLLRSEEIEILRHKPGAMLSIPHYAENPDDDPGMYEDSAAYRAAKDQFLSSFKTWFSRERYGRMPNTAYLFYGEDNYDEQLLPSIRLFAPEHKTELEVLDRGKFPLLLYYADGDGAVEINLTYAGFPKE